MWVGLTLSVEGLARTKDCDISLLLPWNPDLKWKYIISSPGSLACQLYLLGLPRLCKSQSLYHILLGSVSLENSVSVNLTILGASYGWNHIIFVLL